MSGSKKTSAKGIEIHVVNTWTPTWSSVVLVWTSTTRRHGIGSLRGLPHVGHGGVCDDELGEAGHALQPSDALIRDRCWRDSVVINDEAMSARKSATREQWLSHSTRS
jgi:hypothetical protein